MTLSAQRLSMTMSVEPEPTRIPPARSRAPVDAVPNFEAVFRIPAMHRLLAVRSRSRGGAVQGIYWEHEEYDPAGTLVARYQSFDETNAAG